jgi:hypothetical protein
MFVAARALGGRAEEPTAAIIDSQSVKTTEAGGPRGFDAGKKINGRKRHIVTDTQGHMLSGIVHEASIQDRDGAPRVIGFACESFPTVKHVFADSGYAGEKLEAALAKMNGPSSKSSNARMAQRVSSSSHGVGSSNERSPGSIAVEGLPRIGRHP